MDGRLPTSHTLYKIPAYKYRERSHIISDILLKLVEYGELNQTALMSFCGLNLTKHRAILEDMEARGLIIRETRTLGKARSVSLFRATHEGIEFFEAILKPYEKLFPRNSSRISQG